MLPKRADKSPSIYIDINYNALTAHHRQSPLRTAFVSTQIQSRQYHSSQQLWSRKHLIQRKKEADDIYRKIEAPEHTPPFGAAAPDVKLVEWRMSRWVGRFVLLLVVLVALLVLFLYSIFNEDEQMLNDVPDLMLFMTAEFIQSSLLTDRVVAAKLGNDAHTDSAFVRVIYHRKDNHAHVVAPVWGTVNVPAKGVRSQSVVVHPNTQRVNNGTLTLHMIAKEDEWYVEHAVIEFADNTKRELKVVPKPHNLRAFSAVRHEEMAKRIVRTMHI